MFSNSSQVLVTPSSNFADLLSYFGVSTEEFPLEMTGTEHTHKKEPDLTIETNSTFIAVTLGKWASLKFNSWFEARVEVAMTLNNPRQVYYIVLHAGICCPHTWVRGECVLADVHVFPDAVFDQVYEWMNVGTTAQVTSDLAAYTGASSYVFGTLNPCQTCRNT